MTFLVFLLGIDFVRAKRPPSDPKNTDHIGRGIAL